MSKRVLIVSSSEYFAVLIKSIIQAACEFCEPRILTDIEKLKSEIRVYSPDILLVESNIYFGVTPSYIASLMLKYSELTIATFAFEKLSPDIITEFFDGGSVGFVDVREGTKEAVLAMTKILHGDMYIPGKVEIVVAQKGSSEFPDMHLNFSEYWFCKLYSLGRSFADIAVIMQLTKATVYTYFNKIKRKICVHNRNEFVKRCFELKIVKASDLEDSQNITRNIALEIFDVWKNQS
jgi:DNA-binding NarL/FixJ family response regulator